MTVALIVDIIVKCFKNGGKVLICGNGGSMAMASHMAAELVGVYENKKALPAIVLSDTTVITALANDLGYKYIFSRQVEALGRKGDCLIVFSTSGRSNNIIEAMYEANLRGINVIDMPRIKGTTQEIQENQLHLTHEICKKVKQHFK